MTYPTNAAHLPVADFSADDDLVTGAVRWLCADNTVRSAVGATPTGTPYVFAHSLWTAVEGSGNTAIVVRYGGGWAAANLHNTLRFPRLDVDVWADPKRDRGGNAVDPAEVQRRVMGVFAAVDARLHRPQSGVQMWGGVRTIACSRMNEPTVYPAPDGGGLLMLQVFYGVTTG